MAPFLPTILAALVLAASVTDVSASSAPPGRHMAPSVANKLSSSAAVDKRSSRLPPGRHESPSVANQARGHVGVAKRLAERLSKRYYGDSHGLSPPPSLGPSKRDTTIPTGWEYTGCVSESSHERLLQGFAYASGATTPLQCLTICGGAGYSLAGLEYGRECYCGNSYQGTGGVARSESLCNMPCSGDSTDTCGGDWNIAVYQYTSTASDSCTTTIPSNSSSSVNTTVSANATASASISIISSTATATDSAWNSTATSVNATSANANATGTLTSSPLATATAGSNSSLHVDQSDSSEWYSLGCAIDTTNATILNGTTTSNSTGMTTDLCLTECEQAGYIYAGLESGTQCICGSTLDEDIEYDSSSACNVQCGGDSADVCGGTNRVEVYELVSSGDDSDCSTSTATAASTGRASSASLVAAFATSGAVSSANATATASATATAAVTATASSAVTSSTSGTATGTAASASTSIPASSSSHSVYAHFMIGNTYPYSQSDFATDIALAKAAGIDGFALNLGSDWWQSVRVLEAYAAAEAEGDFELFLSLDMTSLSCSSVADSVTLAALVTAGASSSAQATYNSKVLLSTFSGADCTFGQSSAQEGWTYFKAALTSLSVDTFLVPSLFSDSSTFSSNTWMDGELNWNGGWPTGSDDLTTSSDESYMSALGSKEYMAAISPAFFTHFPVSGWNKNWLYRSDDWLYCTRWEQVIAMRDEIKLTEILTWNDYGESTYIGPISGALPSGSDAWVDGFPHTAWLDLTAYYSTAFKTGSYPTIETDKIFVWARPHAKAADASNDSVGKPTRWDDTEDNVYAVVLATESATVTLTSGSSSEEFTVSAGLNKLKMTSAVGSISAVMTRSGSTVASYDAGSAYSYTTTPETYNYNYFVGSSS